MPLLPSALALLESFGILGEDLQPLVCAFSLSDRPLLLLPPPLDLPRRGPVSSDKILRLKPRSEEERSVRNDSTIRFLHFVSSRSTANVQWILVPFRVQLGIFLRSAKLPALISSLRTIERNRISQLAAGLCESTRPIWPSEPGGVVPDILERD